MRLPSFTVCGPLIDQQQNVLGYALRYSAELVLPASLVNCVARVHAASQAPEIKTPFITPVTLDQFELPAGLPHDQTIVSLPARALNQEHTFVAAKAIRHSGYGLYGSRAAALQPGDPALSLASHVETVFDARTLD